jgi:hypothetical protein
LKIGMREERRRCARATGGTTHASGVARRRGSRRRHDRRPRKTAINVGYVRRPYGFVERDADTWSRRGRRRLIRRASARRDALRPPLLAETEQRVEERLGIQR